ncbi:MAG: AraC family transcriptional regulator, partial [Cyanobacteria bacterium J06639_14]
FEQVATNALYTEGLDLCYAARRVRTSAMEQAIGQILSCPYQGKNRRSYLEHKALELVSLHLAAMVPPPITDADRQCVYQAAAILREQIANPPTIEALARQVGTNRLYLKQSFQQVYGTTPFSYSRDCRLSQAWRLLMTSDFTIGQVAAAVGYTNCSHFAAAFRQRMGMNPKVCQMQAWRCAS